MPSALHVAIRSSAIAAAVATVIAACHKDSPVAPIVPTRVSVTQGSDAQVGTAGQRLPSSVTVRALDQNGNPMASVAVSWRILAGGGSLDAAMSTTDAAGDALVNWTLGTAARLDSLQASVGATVSTVVIAIATAGPVTSLKKVGGDQQVPRGTTSAPIIVQAADQYGNVVAHAPVSWAVQSGGALSATQTMTDSGGHATVTLTTDAVASTYTVTARAGALSVTFVVTGS